MKSGRNIGFYWGFECDRPYRKPRKWIYRRSYKHYQPSVANEGVIRSYLGMLHINAGVYVKIVIFLASQWSIQYNMTAKKNWQQLCLPADASPTIHRTLGNEGTSRNVAEVGVFNILFKVISREFTLTTVRFIHLMPGRRTVYHTVGLRFPAQQQHSFSLFPQCTSPLCCRKQVSISRILPVGRA